jgi:serine/threonine-protein kinase HipA
MEQKDTEKELRMLFAPGSSLGGARPKASVRDKDGHLAIAKFPRKDDEINRVVWEAVALSLALNSGIPVPQSRVDSIAGKPVLLLRRFDRDGERRIPFLSAMSMLGSKAMKLEAIWKLLTRSASTAPRSRADQLKSEQKIMDPEFQRLVDAAAQEVGSGVHSD